MKQLPCGHVEIDDECMTCLKEKVARLERAVEWYSAESEAFHIMRQLCDLFGTSDIVNAARLLKLENDKLTKGDSSLGRLALHEILTAYSHERYDDERIKMLYDLLIMKSWENSKWFDICQCSWHVLADLLGIEKIEDNGHGKILYKKNDYFYENAKKRYYFNETGK